MEVRKLKKQLAVAIVMVLISALALSSATYAWYASSNVVKAKGMEINAKTEGTSFEITLARDDGSAPDDAEWPKGQTIATYTAAAATLYPVHPVIFTDAYSNDSVGETAAWYHAFSKEYDNAEATADQTLLDGIAINGDKLKLGDNAYALAVTFYVRLNPVSAGASAIISNLVANNVKITDESTDEDNKLADCVYLLVAGEEGAYEITTDGNKTADDTTFTAATESGVLVSEIAADGVPHKITVYAFFEGMDQDCKTSNYSADNISVSLDFVGEPGTK